jgi:hypothetical protein
MVQLYRNNSILCAYMLFTAFIMLHTLALRRYQEKDFFHYQSPSGQCFGKKLDFCLFFQYVHAQQRIW